MYTRIAKEFTWEMSHRLPFHSGLCRNIHGHSYKLRLELGGEPDPQNSMLIDYFIMSQIVELPISELNHAFLCDSSDIEVIDFLKSHNFKCVVIPYYSTAENILKYLADRLTPLFSKYKNISEMHLRLAETADVFAEITVKL